MNHLLVGTADKTEQLLQLTSPGFLLIDDGPIADAFLAQFPRAKLFDPSQHSFNPLRGIDADRARDFADILYLADPGGENTLTARNGKGALAQLFLDNTRLDRITGDRKDPAIAEALGVLDRALFSPLVTGVLCNPTNFSFKGSVVARIDRAALYHKDAMLLALLLIGQHKGQIVLPGTYLRPLHMSLIRQSRLTVGVRQLSELPENLSPADFDVRAGRRTRPEDAVVLASYEGLSPGTTKHTDFVQTLTGAL